MTERSEWRACQLGDVVNLKRGYDLPHRDRRAGEFPIVSSSGVTGYHAEAKVRGPGVVTGRYGTLGDVYFVREDFWPLNTALYVENFKGNDPRFVSFLLGQLNLGKQNAAGAVPGVNRNHLHTIAVRIPALPVQERIASILSAYDDLIENCERRIRVLDEMARALYREWFVLFRYPGHEKTPLVDSALGRLPQGWSRRSVKEIADVMYGFPFKSNLFSTKPSDGTPIVRIRDVPVGASFTYTTETADERYVIKHGDLLVGMDGDFHISIWSNGPAVLNQRVARFRATKPWSPLHLLLALRGPIEELNKSIVGTTVAHLGDMHIRNIALLQPSETVSVLAYEAFFALGTEIAKLQQVARNARKTRELLLPRLLSGELSVT